MLKPRDLRLLPVALLTVFAMPAQAGVGSFARVEPQSNPGVISNPFDVDTTNRASSGVTATIGNAEAFAAAAPGALAGDARVQLFTDLPYFGGSLTAFAQGDSHEALTFGNLYCVESLCVDALSLGIDHISVSAVIRASGGVVAFGSSQYDSAFSEVDYGWAVTGAQNGTVSGGGSKSRNTAGFGEVKGSISSQSAEFTVRPGQGLELGLSMSVFAQASIGGLSENETNAGKAASATAIADFAHTLEWMGVSSFTAFDASGMPIDLTPGGRFTILGESGHDFWNASPGIKPVPLPTSLLLLAGGLPWLGRRRPKN